MIILKIHFVVFSFSILTDSFFFSMADLLMNWRSKARQIRKKKKEDF